VRVSRTRNVYTFIPNLKSRRRQARERFLFILPPILSASEEEENSGFSPCPGKAGNGLVPSFGKYIGSGEESHSAVCAEADRSPLGKDQREDIRVPAGKLEYSKRKELRRRRRDMASDGGG